ncbi:MarR family transcriptional regulator [Roseomonas sp. KE2513]|uniref:MarR family winged helix-turn-helix transcriptional regulator n=1 Tax=Roseomonas sp. KE2513 TaxID=2479202 RepID=UPI0018E0276F|nr:MarR family transcriptional regulator [Roseomonas sp. KE2513]MBI0539024.1 MarR family transcriptional regulator [Roseomonas sp. KE2513]
MPSGITPLPFDESTGFLLRYLNRVVQREIATRIQPFGVTLGAWYMLRVVWEEDSLTQRELAQRVGMAEPTAVIALRSMEAQGWIQRLRSETDQRKIHVNLTPTGRDLREALLPVAHDVNRRITRGLTADETTFFRALLKRAADSFAAEQAEPSVRNEA